LRVVWSSEYTLSDNFFTNFDRVWYHSKDKLRKEIEASIPTLALLKRKCNNQKYATSFNTSTPVKLAGGKNLSGRSYSKIVIAISVLDVCRNGAK